MSEQEKKDLNAKLIAIQKIQGWHFAISVAIGIMVGIIYFKADR